MGVTTPSRFRIHTQGMHLTPEQGQTIMFWICSGVRCKLPAADSGEGMTEPVVVVDPNLVADAERIIGTGLDAFNDEVTEVNDRQPLAVVVRDPETGAILGGAAGRTSLGLLFINVFHLPKHLRGAGLGSRVLHLAEEEARRRGCFSGVLLTISFQAPAFYERHGWRRFGEVPCHPTGTSRIYMMKEL